MFKMLGKDKISKEEDKISSYWQDIDILKKSIDKGDKYFVFGPQAFIFDVKAITNRYSPNFHFTHLRLDETNENFTSSNINLVMAALISTKTKYERMENLKDAFTICDKDFDKNLEILILDDIFTTGSTFESMIEEFYKNGYKKITCLATASAN